MKLTLALVLFAGVACAQQPNLVNGQLTTASGAQLENAVRGLLAAQSGPSWIGWAVPIIKGDRHSCCWNGNGNSGCMLEQVRGQDYVAAPPAPTPVQLEGPTHLFVLLRAEAGKVDKIRTFTPDCTLDVGGLALHWLTGVAPAESVRLLSGQGDHAVSAIALHNDPAADAALEAFTAPSQPDKVRRNAAFWLGQARGRRGFDILNRLLREDANDNFREHVVFALSQSKEPDAIPAVIRVAHEDRSPRVRGRALFWLAQRAGKQVAGTEIASAIANDPDTEVKKKAVFALSRIPDEQGVPLLIDAAKNNRNPVVRKEAVFWLGNSKDPRALAFIEGILTR